MISWQVPSVLPSSAVLAGTAAAAPSQAAAPHPEPAPSPAPAAPAPAPVAKKVSGRSLPNFSFTGAMDVQPRTSEAAAEYSDAAGISSEQTAAIKGCWSEVGSHLERTGRIRLQAAIANMCFRDGGVVVTVANKALQQELMDARMEIQDFIASRTSIRVSISVEVTKDEVFIAKPVSDAQRLEAMMEKNGNVRILCEELKLRL